MSGDVVAEPRTASDSALRYAVTPLAFGVRRALGAELWKLPRQELIPRLKQTFGGAEELKAALQDAYERALQSMVVGLKAPWLLMETGEKDYCESFTQKVCEPFKQESGIDGRLLIDFLDTVFLEQQAALDAGPTILGLEGLDDDGFFERLLDAGDATGDANELAARATQSIREGFIAAVGFEEEHPIVRFSQWHDLLADGLIFHAADIARAHPSWSRYLDLLDEEKLSRQDMRAAAERDEAERGRVALARGLLSRIEGYRSSFGDVLPNREWLFDLGDRLEDSEENVQSELLQGKPMQSRDLPVVVRAALGHAQKSHGVSRIVRAADALVEPKPSTIDVLRRARRDFRRCHWQGEGYADAALDLGSLMFAVLGPRGSERYFREALAFGGDRATSEYALYMATLALDDKRAAIHHLQAAIQGNPDQFEPFDTSRYELQTILGAGGAGVSFLVGIKDGPNAGKDAVVKTLWDEIAVTDPRPALKELQALDKARIKGAAKIIHLCGYKKRATFVVTDFVEGDDLESFREAHGGEAQATLVAEIGWRIAEILAKAHAAGVVHRNLKPGNVRVGAGEEGLEVTLLDFAIPNYVLAHEGRIRGVRRLAAWSRLGRAIAEDLAAYNAPEVLKGGVNAATPRSDLYSLGATLYRLATGASPRKIDPEGLPPALRDAIVRCLDKSPDNRPASADEVRQLLQDAARRLEGEESGEAPALSDAHEDEFGLKGLNPAATMLDGLTKEADPFAAPSEADPFAAPADPFAAPAASAATADPFAPAADPFGAPADPFAPAPAAGADPFGAPAAGVDPFGAPTADPFGAPTADPFGAPAPAAGADPFGAPTADPFGAPTADPFAPAPAAGADPFGAPTADPFGAPTADPFGAPTADPFGAPTADPFGAPADPFAPAPAAGADPFAPTADPFGAPAAQDPFAPAGADPFGAPADPFAPAGGQDLGVTVSDPFAPAASDPFAQAAPFGLESGVAAQADPFAAPAPAPTRRPPGKATGARRAAGEDEAEALDPNEALALLEQLMSKRPPTAKKKKPGRAPAAPDPFAASDIFGAAPLPMQASTDPLMAGGDPFAPSADPFAAQASSADPFAPLPVDPFAPVGSDPFAQPSTDVFAPAPNDPFAPLPVDPFAAQAPPADPFGSDLGAANPFAQADQGWGAPADPFAPQPGAGIADPFLSAEAPLPGGVPNLAVPPEDDLPMLEASAEAPMGLEPPPGFAAPPPPAARGARPAPAAKGGAPARKAAPAPAGKVDEDGYGLVISGLALKSKKEAAINILVEVRKITREEAYELCRSPVVPVLKRVTKAEAEAAAEKFKAAKINCRITERKDRR